MLSWPSSWLFWSSRAPRRPPGAFTLVGRLPDQRGGVQTGWGAPPMNSPSPPVATWLVRHQRARQAPPRASGQPQVLMLVGRVPDQRGGADVPSLPLLRFLFSHRPRHYLQHHKRVVPACWRSTEVLQHFRCETPKFAGTRRLPRYQLGSRRCYRKLFEKAEVSLHANLKHCNTLVEYLSRA